MPEPQRRFHIPTDDYPFADCWFERRGSALHYVDEGTGPAVLMLHGNPTWSYLYRSVIKGMADRCRCIAPDYPGFGLSDHPPGYGYLPAEHADWVRALIDHLGLKHYVLVVQDWGGPIGLSIATQRPEQIAGLVICNTWCWPPFPNARIFSRLMGGPVGKFLNLYLNFFARAMVPLGIHHRQARTAAVRACYTRPFPDPASRMGTWVFPRQIIAAAPWLASIEKRMSVLRDKPIQLVWATRDPAFGSEQYIRRWLDHFPKAALTRIPDASHYIQEDRPDAVIAAIEAIGCKG